MSRDTSKDGANYRQYMADRVVNSESWIKGVLARAEARDRADDPDGLSYEERQALLPHESHVYAWEAHIRRQERAAKKASKQAWKVAVARIMADVRRREAERGIGRYATPLADVYGPNPLDGARLWDDA